MLATCHVCPRACSLAEGQVGVCRARGNVEGEIVCLNYGRLTSVALDPVEKKPLACWESGKMILSVGSYGCNLSCPFCQNHSIAQVGEDEVGWRQVLIDELVDAAVAARDQDNIGIAFTYNEPLVGYEFVRDTALLAHALGLKTALVTNGVASPDVFDEVIAHIDAVNIDLKGFSREAYGACGMEEAFDVVKRNIETAVALPTCHVEVTSLIVPGIADAHEMEQAACWLASLDPGIPYHISQYHPAFHYHERPLPDAEVRAYAQRAQAHLQRVFTGNM